MSYYHLRRSFVSFKDGITLDVDSIQIFVGGGEEVKSSRAKNQLYSSRDQYQRLTYYNRGYFTGLLIENIARGGIERNIISS